MIITSHITSRLTMDSFSDFILVELMGKLLYSTHYCRKVIYKT